jgi:hypothetical protein
LSLVKISHTALNVFVDGVAFRVPSSLPIQINHLVGTQIQAVIKPQMEGSRLINSLIYTRTPITRSSTFVSEFLWFLRPAGRPAGVNMCVCVCVCGQTPSIHYY